MVVRIHTTCSAYIASKYDIAIEGGKKKAKINETLSSSNGWKNMPHVVFCLNQRPLKIWAALRRLFSFLEILCEQNSFVNLPDLRAIKWGHHPTHKLPFGLRI